MNLENRIIALENKVGCNDEPGPLIRIDIADFSKDSKNSKGVLTIAIIPGRVGRSGITLFRDPDEAPDDFLRRSEAKHAKFYAS